MVNLTSVETSGSSIWILAAADASLKQNRRLVAGLSNTVMAFVTSEQTYHGLAIRVNFAAAAIDQAEHGTDAAREEAAARAGLLTPITKAFCSEVGVEVSSIGLQVHGGMGYVKETGAAQFYATRGSRRSTKALDLVIRKLPRDRWAAKLFGEYEANGRAAEKCDATLFGRSGSAVRDAVADLRRVPSPA